MSRSTLTYSASLVISLLLSACSSSKTDSPVEAPGKPETPRTKILETGAAVLQSNAPIDAINAYLDGFHFYNGHPGIQMEAHHYCSILNEDVIQCVIFDGTTRDAKIMGVEYIINKSLYVSLPTAEKSMWHSHAYEVSSGQLIAPGIPAPAEHALMERLANTYGKTWHTWHTDQDKQLPLGVPQLMMGFTADGQVDPKMVKQRNDRLGVDTNKKKLERADIQIPKVDPGADAWMHGKVFQISDPTGHGVHNMAPSTLPQNTNSRSSQ